MLLGHPRLVNRCLLASVLFGSAGLPAAGCVTSPGPGTPTAPAGGALGSAVAGESDETRVPAALFLAGAASVAITPEVPPGGPPTWLAGVRQGGAASRGPGGLFARGLAPRARTRSVAL